MSVVIRSDTFTDKVFEEGVILIEISFSDLRHAFGDVIVEALVSFVISVTELPKNLVRNDTGALLTVLGLNSGLDLKRVHGEKDLGLRRLLIHLLRPNSIGTGERGGALGNSLRDLLCRGLSYLVLGPSRVPALSFDFGLYRTNPTLESYVICR